MQGEASTVAAPGAGAQTIWYPDEADVAVAPRARAARVVLFMASEDSGMMTGVVVPFVGARGSQSLVTGEPWEDLLTGHDRNLRRGDARYRS